MSGAFEVLLTTEKGGLSKTTQPVELNIGGERVNAMKHVWYINEDVYDTLMNPQHGIAWALHEAVAPRGIDQGRCEGEFVSRGQKRRHGGSEKEVPTLTSAVRDVLLQTAAPGWRYLGLTQYELDTSNSMFTDLEDKVRKIAEDPRCKEATGAEQVLRENGVGGVNTVDISASKESAVARIKCLWPKYQYGKGGGCKHGMCSPAALPDGATKCKACGNSPQVTVGGCDNMPTWVKSFALDLMHATTADGEKVCKLSDINAALLNIYLKNQGSSYGLGRHFDSPHIFDRPIYTLRFLRPGVLSFVPGGLRQNALAVMPPNPRSAGFPIYFEIPLSRGCLTEMTGFAANVLQHCVRFGDEVGASASLVLRHIHTSLLTPAWLSQNEARRKRMKHNRRPDAESPNHRVVAAAAAS